MKIAPQKKRFRAIFDAMKMFILEAKKKVLLISLCFKTEAVIDRFGLRAEMERLVKSYDTFVYSPVWAPIQT